MKTKSIISVIISFMIVSIPICFLAFLDRKDLSQLTGNGLLKTKAYEVNLMFFIIAIILLLLLLGFWWIKFLQKDLESYIGIHHLLWIVFFILYGIFLFAESFLMTLCSGMFITYTNIPKSINIIYGTVPILYPIIFLLINKFKQETVQ